MKNKLIFLFLFMWIHVSAFSLTSAKVEFLSAPEEITEVVTDDRDLDMTMGIGQESFLRWVTKGAQAYFEIVLAKFPDCFDASDCDHFSQQDGKHFFSYGEKIPFTINNTTYTAAERRIFETCEAKLIDRDQLTEILTTSNCVFYTGAGISAASNVPMMDELLDLLELAQGPEVVYSIQNMVREPQVAASRMIVFHNACLFSPPTPAHVALAAIAKELKTKIITENVDTLHEQTGIMPYRIDGGRLRNEIDLSTVSEIDYVICIGLSFDDKGFLGWYKQNHPNGKIIAIDISEPSYLGPEDFLLKEDLQDVLTSIKM